MPVLYVVATPIGNLEDISLRALRILREVALIAAEDTRKTRRLLARHGISTPTTSYFEHNKLTKLNYIMGCLQQADVALVSDAGMPGVADPGYELINAACQREIKVVPVPGPSAIITALAVSGLPGDRFTYLGFLPRKTRARQQALEALAREPGTLVILEAPHRLRETLADSLLILGDRELAVCRELTKVHEEIFRGTISQALNHFTGPRGEFTLVIAGMKAKQKPAGTAEVGQRLREMYRSCMTAREAVALLAEETGLSRKELYRTWLKFNETVTTANNSGGNTERR